jgi:hypothetical protein
VQRELAPDRLGSAGVRASSSRGAAPEAVVVVRDERGDVVHAEHRATRLRSPTGRAAEIGAGRDEFPITH